jgi:hypothetical protein
MHRIFCPDDFVGVNKKFDFQIDFECSWLRNELTTALSISTNSLRLAPLSIWSRLMIQKILKMFPSTAAMLGVGVMVALSSGMGALVGAKIGTSNPSHPIPLRADTAVKGKTLSMATGLVSPEVEGLYVLDHASGMLQCWILNPRTGAVGGVFQTNVLAELATDKTGAGDYVMTTGGFAFTGGVTGNVLPANSIVYIADEATGKVAGYNFNYNRNELNRGIMQRGLLRAVCGGETRGGTVTRDQ